MCEHQWIVYEFEVVNELLLVQCRYCGITGYIEDVTDDEKELASNSINLPFKLARGANRVIYVNRAKEEKERITTIARGPGRPKEWHRPKDLKRVKLNSFRLPLRWVRWLHKQNDSGGRLIERALEDYYRVDWGEESVK